MLRSGSVNVSARSLAAAALSPCLKAWSVFAALGGVTLALAAGSEAAINLMKPWYTWYHNAHVATAGSWKTEKKKGASRLWRGVQMRRGGAQMG